MFADCLDAFETVFPITVSIIMLIHSDEIGKMPLEDFLKKVYAPGLILTALLSQF